MKVIVTLNTCFDAIVNGEMKTFSAIYGEVPEVVEETLERDAEPTLVDGKSVLTVFARPLDDFNFLRIGVKNPIKVNKRHIITIIPFTGETPETQKFETWDAATGPKEITISSRLYIAE